MHDCIHTKNILWEISLLSDCDFLSSRPGLFLFYIAYQMWRADLTKHTCSLFIFPAFVPYKSDAKPLELDFTL